MLTFAPFEKLWHRGPVRRCVFTASDKSTRARTKTLADRAWFAQGWSAFTIVLFQTTGQLKDKFVV